MKTITICKTKEGFIVVNGTVGYSECPKDLFDRSHCFHSTRAAVGLIRQILDGWNDKGVLTELQPVLKQKP